MKTKALMIASSLFLGIAGLFALFAPEELLKLIDLPQTNPLPILIQLMGALYLSFVLMNWTAKDNIEPLPRGIIQAIEALHYKWSDELDIQAEPWTM